MNEQELLYSMMVNPPDRKIWTRFCKYFTPGDWLQCWTWHKSTTSGYGKLWIAGKLKSVHRLMAEWFYGTCLECVDHVVCSNPPCVNPLHLLPTSFLFNNTRSGCKGIASVNKSKTHCRNGHPFNDKNTMLILKASGRMQRRCRKCHP